MTATKASFAGSLDTPSSSTTANAYFGKPVLSLGFAAFRFDVGDVFYPVARVDTTLVSPGRVEVYAVRISD